MEKIDNWLKLPEPFGKNRPKDTIIAAIDKYIKVAESGINVTQNALTSPLKENFDGAREVYVEWVLRTFEFLNSIGRQDDASTIFSSPDGVHTFLNSYPERIRNTAPVFFYEEKGDGKTYVDEAGVETLRNIRESLREKIAILRSVRSRFERQYRDSKRPSLKPGGDSPATFAVTIKDREIWVNDFLLSKPYSVKRNKYFFDYLFDYPDRELVREKMPAPVKDAMGGKIFSKILNELGFKGQILKAFFPKRGKSALLFRKSVSKEQLIKDGVHIELLLQELLTAHTRNTLRIP